MMTVIWEALPADSILAGDRSVTVWLLLILLAAVIGAYLWGLNRREKKGHADQLTARYKSLDESALAEIPDDRLVDAVAANVIAKLDPRRARCLSSGSHAVPRSVLRILCVAGVPRMCTRRSGRFLRRSLSGVCGAGR